MRLFIFFILLLIPFSVFANSYTLTCISDKNFLTVYSIDETNKKIIHLSSKNLNSGKEFNNLNKNVPIIYWKNNEAHSFSLSSAGTPGLRSFDLLNYNYIDTGHYLSKPDWEYGYAYSSFFECIKG